jgi:hypothetical protein
MYVHAAETHPQIQRTAARAYIQPFNETKNKKK